MNDHLSLEEIAALVDEPSQNMAGSEHLKTCERCREEYATMRRVRDALAALPDLSPSQNEWERLAARDLIARRGRMRTRAHATEMPSLSEDVATSTGEILSISRRAFGDDYVIERALGRRGMRFAFLARDRADRRVVMNVLRPELDMEGSVEGFQRVIKLLASLQHPFIVLPQSAGVTGGLHYYTMPFVEGESLAEKIAREGALPVDDTIRILTDVTEALAYAHAHNVVHGSLEPHNVLLSGEHALLTDFGVPKAPGTTAPGMGPDQAADLYALGALAYAMLTGRRSVVDPPAATLVERPDVPAALKRLVMRCLALDPADRGNSADILRRLKLMASGGVAVRWGVRVFALATVGVTAGMAGYVLVRRPGLALWVLYATLGVLAITLPFILVAVWRRRRI